MKIYKQTDTELTFEKARDATTWIKFERLQSGLVHIDKWGDVALTKENRELLIKFLSGGQQ